MKSLPQELAFALADDSETLALLQDRELSAEILLGLRHVGFPANLALLPEGDACQAHELMAAAMTALPEEVDSALLDGLAADFAAIYLNGSLGASPSESVWLSDDHLSCQESMFALRDLYAAQGLAAPDWRRRPDDHLVFQLQFLAHGLRHGKGTETLTQLAGFLDEHLLRWLPDFARRVASRCDTSFYAALTLLTAAWVDQFRDLLAHVLEESRPSRESIDARMHRQSVSPESTVLAFVPGVGPTL
ncbi:MAG: dehydrogenase [Rhodocyclaceae bacterium]|nr:dehydrogenase [Rhodocyclaceae bacterium]